MKDGFFVQYHHDPLIAEKEEVVSYKHFLADPNYHRLENGFIDQYVEEKYVDLMCIFDDIPYFNDFPKYHHYDDNYVLQTQANFIEQSVASLWDEETQFQQLEYCD